MLLALTPVAAFGGNELPQSCTYQTFKWNVMLRKSVAHETVRHPYSELTPEERDPASGCSVCEEDQETVDIPPLADFRVCRKLASQVRSAVAELIRAGEPIHEVVGYRVGRTRGDPDAAGNRTGFSNHSYGIAIDINPQQNGLYDNCLNFGSACRLIRGGAWRPGVAGTMTAGGAVVRAMSGVGLRWGGEIAGKQKDFMHFSPSGY